MAKYLNNLCSEDLGFYEGNLVRKLTKPLIWIDGDLRIEMPIDMESDGASVPRIPLIYDAWGGRAPREAFGHDFGYRIDSVLIRVVSREINEACIGPIPEKYILRRESIPKLDADWYFRITMRDRPYSYFVYQPMYLAVRVLGNTYYHRMKVMDHFEVTQ